MVYGRSWHSRKIMFSLLRASTTCFCQLRVVITWKAKRPEKKRKTWPGFKNNKSGISIFAFKRRKCWRENSSKSKGEETLHCLHAAEIQMYLSHVPFALSHYKKYYYISIGRFSFPFLFFWCYESSERKQCCITLAEWTFYTERPSSLMSLVALCPQPI